ITATFKELRFTRLSLNQLLQDLSEQFRPLAQAQAIDFQTQLDSNFVVKGDHYRLSRLFTNILENAFQYSNPGDRITLSTKLTHNIVTITIEDTGIGIAEEHLPYIFQDFWRSDLAISKEPEGFGLGLTIAQAIVQQHRGKIIVSSMPGVGSCIQVELCLA
ncbi:MAG: ATP-binding protein, partial [Cyanobacteria bacterium J06638_38]